MFRLIVSFYFLLAFSINLISQETKNALSPSNAMNEKNKNSSNELKLLEQVKTLLENNQTEEALDKLIKITQTYKNIHLINLYLEMANIFESHDNWKMSLKAYQNYLKTIENMNVSLENYWNIGWAHFMTGDPEKALQDGLKFSKAFPNSTFHNLNLALYYLTLGYTLESVNLYMWAFSVTLDQESLYRVALEDLSKAKDLFFYAFAKKRIESIYSQLRNLYFLQRS